LALLTPIAGFVPNSVVAFRSVAAYVPPGVTVFGLGLIGEIFQDRRAAGGPDFTLTLCADRRGPVRTDLGTTLVVNGTLDQLAAADLALALPGTQFRNEPSAASIEAFRAAHSGGAIVASHCVGAFLLAAAGLLDHRRATTHWRFAADLAACYPAVTVDSSVLYLDEGRIVTGAGAAAGIDMCLHVVRREHGTAAANAIARDLVVAPYREGGQAQFVPAPVPAESDDDRLNSVLDWARTNLDQRISIAELAARAFTSRRTFVRRFRDVTGTTPYAWLIEQRLNLAEELLETTSAPVDEVARRSGFGSAAILREQFVRRRGVPPTSYRRTFVAGGRPPAPPNTDHLDG
jgi:transcriptional regulator GlxA family with amidase domain